MKLKVVLLGFMYHFVGTAAKGFRLRMIFCSSELR